MEGFARWLVRHPYVVLAASLVATVALGRYAVQVRIESSLESMLPAGDPAIPYYNEVRAIFGSDDVGVVGVRCDDLYTPATLAKLAHVTDELSKIDGVERVLSVTNAVDPAADVITPPPLLPRIPPTAQDVALLKEKLSATPLYRRNLVAEDGRGAAINVFLKPLTDTQYADLRIDDRILDILARAEGPERFYYTGAAHVKLAAVKIMQRDLSRFTPLAIGLVLVVLWVSFGTRRGVMLPFLTVVTALIWTLGIMVLMGRAITLGTFILPPLLLVLGSSYAIHVMARYYEQVTEGRERQEVVERAYARVWLPLAISGLTTMIGFGSLMVNRIPAIKELGLFAVIGVLCLTVTCLTALPATLALLQLERVRKQGGSWMPRLVPVLDKLGDLAYRHRWSVIVAALLVGVVSMFGAARIEVDSDFLYYFQPSSPVRQANETINREVVGSNPFYIVIEGSQPDTLRRWGVLWEIQQLQKFLETLPGVTSSISIVDYLELLEKGLAKSGTGDLVLNEAGDIVPAEPPAPFWQDPRNLEPILKMVTTSPETFKGVVTKDFRKASILVRTNLSGSRAVESTLAKIYEYVGRRFPAEIQVRLTGTLVLLTGTTSDIVAGQVKSLVIALAVIFVVMAVMFLSVRVGALAIVPNILPIPIFFGVMGWMGIRLNLGTSLIASIALGIAVDSTIHYMSRLNLELQGETDQGAAVRRALRTVGVPIVSTTVALLLGFLTFAFSGFVPIQNFGVLAGVTMVTGLIANLVLLPAMLAATPIITVWDLVRTRLGQDPEGTIPLFNGLRRGQARIVALMGQLRRYAPGQPLIRQGEEGNEMYVVIQGRAEIFIGGDGTRRSVGEIARGDVVGEMGLVRRHRRTADVVATSPLEVLAVDERFLSRLQRRYPRIASKVFLNLTRILSDRVQRTNEQLVAAR